MTDHLHFNRDAVGVSAKKNWADSEDFGILGAAAGRLNPEAAVEKPSSLLLAFGFDALQAALTNFCSDLSHTLHEFSDACAILGSGTEEAISDFDETEQRNEKAYLDIQQRMSGKS
ncbi:hypothetical protein EII34_12715 [Arachnia propionica]|uniref:Uncharacterized protein n=1 Tax=Arachnia propionica TaxID=1750 RepID=A0A3P1T2U3_9ACTN|nr:hypothetical protein [Arachnia propionica]MDO5083004.1 hypothetical protein [Arachnia propionica]RRD03670.1 hypothetical protein EII34_12715 [Arachnia propionica]